MLSRALLVRVVCCCAVLCYDCVDRYEMSLDIMCDSATFEDERLKADNLADFSTLHIVFRNVLVNILRPLPGARAAGSCTCSRAKEENDISGDKCSCGLRSKGKFFHRL